MVIYLSENALSSLLRSEWSPNASGAVIHDLCKDSGICRYKLTGKLSVKYVTSFMDDPMPEALDRNKILLSLEEEGRRVVPEDEFDKLCSSLHDSIIS